MIMAWDFASMGNEELEATIERLEAEVAELKSKGISLDMARGKPSPEQVDLSRPLLDVLDATSDLHDEGADAANYGVPWGIPSAKRLMAAIMGCHEGQVVVAGASSLNIQFDCLVHAWVRGIRGHAPWGTLERVAFLCPSPGYDRHFAMTEHFGIENIPVPLEGDGPDMDMVEELVRDPAVKGMWVVPKYQNPTGITFSDEVVRRIARLEPAASDFRVFWDNAYAVHDLLDEGDELLEVFGAIDEEGGRDLVYEFASTSKITFPGSGIAAVAASAADLADLEETFAIERVCADKVNMLRHARYLPDLAAVRAHMAREAEVLRPRFEVVERSLEEGLSGIEDCSWGTPRGGYFVSFRGPEGSAKAIVSLCREVGVTLTPAGATWPGGEDPKDRDLRIAPSYPTLEELSAAMDVFCACARLVCARLERRGRG